MEQRQRSPWQDLAEWTGTSELKILLDHPQGVFYPGSQVAGRIMLQVDGPKPFLGLRLRCQGEGLVFFTDRSAGFRRRFTNDESYLSEELYLFGDGETEVSIPDGDNVFPFSVSLPDNVPCSFEGRYGRVRYSISAALERTKLVRMMESVPFTVAPVLDLNKDSLATLPISEDNSKAIVGHPEPLNMLVTLPVRGFVPGQTIPVKIILNNPCNVDIRKLRVVLKKVITYHAKRKSRRHKEIIVEIDIPVVKDQSDYETGVDVPAVPPTGMNFCSIIDICYTLKVEACVEVNEWYLKILQKNLKTRMKVVVGTVPLRHYETPEEMTCDIDDDFEKAVSITSGGINERGKSVQSGQSADINFYEESKIYPSSKPNRDDPTGDDDEADGSAKSYAPLYRVYTFNKRKDSDSKSRR